MKQVFFKLQHGLKVIIKVKLRKQADFLYRLYPISKFTEVHGSFQIRH